MIKNIIFDIGNVILTFDVSFIVSKFTTNKEEQDFIIDNVIKSPEWLGYGLIDTGYLDRSDVIEIIKDRTNHVHDRLIEDFLYNYNDYSYVNEQVLDLIKKLKKNNYKVYLLSNINDYTHNSIKDSGLFELVDGYILSYQVHMIKPYFGIYKELVNKYDLNISTSLFIDDNINNVKTALQLGFKSKQVIADNYDSIISVLDSYNINYK